MKTLRIKALAKLEWRRILRDRMSFSLILVVPAIQILLFGAAINLNPSGVKIAIAGGTPSQVELVTAMVAETGYFAPPEIFSVSGSGRNALVAGLAQVAIDLPDEDILYENPELELGSIEVSIDGSDIGAVLPAVRTLERQVWSRFANQLVQTEERQGLVKSLENINLSWVYNPDKLTVWSLMPGLIGVVTMISMLMLGALCISREKEQGSWELLGIMPITAEELILGKSLPYVAVAAVQVLLVTNVAVFVFDVPLVGSVWALAVLALMAALVHLVTGLLISVLASNQLQALQIAVGLYLPSMLLSGFMFPFSGMPSWAQMLGQALPLTYFVSSARDIMLKGGQGWPLEAIVVLGMIALLIFLCLRMLLNKSIKKFP